MSTAKSHWLFFVKMLHHRLLIGFLDMFLCNAVKKFLTFKRHLTNHIKHFVSLFLSCIFYFVKQIKKTCYRNKRFRFSLHSLFLKKIHIRDWAIMMSTRTGSGEIFVFKQHAYCSFLLMGVDGDVKKLVIFVDILIVWFANINTCQCCSEKAILTS